MHITTTYFGVNCSSIQGHPPKHNRFKDKRIPRHITYAYKKDVTIIKNDDFYQLPDNETHTIDLLFLMSNAPVSTASFPEAGSESYVGLANAMELAVDELSTMFPEVLRGETPRFDSKHDGTIFVWMEQERILECETKQEVWILQKIYVPY